MSCFSDSIEKDNKSSPKLLSTKENLATHILQYFYKSHFTNFDFQCAYFVTRGITAVLLNCIVWQGISLLKRFEFDVLLTICDGASENRKFIQTKNGFQGPLCKGYNPFSQMAIFFLSDPPHLMKKLQNILNSIGDRNESNQFTRLLKRNKQEIFWKHIVSIYDRDKLRHCYVTSLRRSDVFLDSLTKMKVKYAVDVLSNVVASEMQKNDNARTIETQAFLKNCDQLWKVFNDLNRLSDADDERLNKLEEVIQYFGDWKLELQDEYGTKSERAKHFIIWQTHFDIQVSIFMSQYLKIECTFPLPHMQREFLNLQL